MVQADAPPVIELRGIDKSFGDVHANREVPLESEREDLVQVFSTPASSLRAATEKISDSSARPRSRPTRTGRHGSIFRR